MKLEGRSAIITGASQGLGKAIAQAFVEAGANVCLCARDEDLLRRTQAELQVSSSRQVLAQGCDVSDRMAVHDLVCEAIRAFGQVHILVNNAGIYGPMGTLDTVDPAEWMRAIEINLFGTMFVMRELLPHMRQHAYGKIINLSGGGATKSLPYMSAYAASKAAVVRLTETVADEIRGAGIDINSVAPGALNTRLLDQVLEAGPERVGQKFYDQALRQKEEGGAPLERGADLCVFLASAESDGITGRLISAIWDPWEDLPDRLEALSHSDIYTLRRITPEDRGQEWAKR